MLDGVILLWFVLTAVAVGFVAFDIRSTPESPVLKWGFVLLTAYTGPIGAFLYVLGCREPLPGLHERYTAARWRQVLGSTMHCVAGDGVDILAGAVIGSYLILSRPIDIALEYAVGFGFGWTIFQALFMRDAAGGSYGRGARNDVPTRVLVDEPADGRHAAGRFGGSPAGREARAAYGGILVHHEHGSAGRVRLAYPINWWLVARGLKHGMMTVRPPPAEHAREALHELPHAAPHSASTHPGHAKVLPKEIAWATMASVAAFALGTALAFVLGQ